MMNDKFSSRATLLCTLGPIIFLLKPPSWPSRPSGDFTTAREGASVLPGKRARCYRSCQSQRLGGPASRHRASEDVRSDFQRRVPYNYLQRAYIKLVGLWRFAVVGGIQEIAAGTNFTPSALAKVLEFAKHSILGKK
ncbi:hypothetical protein CB1_001118036 [Camelus ferus]|nr:hypothetical protein CB1_001118036 [Camelus ferus]